MLCSSECKYFVVSKHVGNYCGKHVRSVREDDPCYSESEIKGIKHDDGKLRWDLLPLKPVEETVRVITFGADKYGPYNWQQVENGHERYFAALMRHLVAYRKGEKNDPETGISHLAHAMCNLIFMDHFNKDDSCV